MSVTLANPCRAAYSRCQFPMFADPTMQMPGQTVILTHEHADFDALASMLGAALLFPDALPVLPRKCNRNAQAFLSLHRDRFPFIEARDLGRAHVDLAILVDTRSANRVPGMDRATGHLVIDHHANAEPLPDGWQPWTDALQPGATGANATLLVERLKRQQATLSSLQATLLALGIYEDTGNLLYASTTHRDIRCAAWLVEQGAQLETLRRFIRYPLSAAQQKLTRQLTEGAHHLTVAGQKIVLALADAPGFADDISSLAYGLRELFDPDALFVIVSLGDRVQVVARSATEAVDVGTIAKQLGGGGHSRAAAALLQGATPAEVRDRIIDLLPKHTHPPATVAQIISRGHPRALDGDMPVAAAMELMQRYGHEGFPVLRKGDDGASRLVGILTRREADRTLSHRMGALPVHKVMRQGAYTIRADAPVEALHRLMLESGWWQIPVADATGALVGIVTRTDLLKLWGEAGQAPAQIPDAGRELEQTLTAAQRRMLRTVGETAAAMGQAVYVVGGFVRDLLLGRIDASSGAGPLDMDLVVEGDAIRLAERMQAKCGGRVVTHARFGTAKWLLDEPGRPLTAFEPPARGDARRQTHLPPHFDFVTARTEFYAEPTVLPTVEQGSIKLDLHRRDFTINTLAIALTPERWGDLLDFYGGLADLQAGLVRVLHSLSFVDDPTRILRAVRYEQRFNFQIEARTEEHLLDAVPLLGRVTAARIRHELERIFQEARPEDAIMRLQELGVLIQIHPELRAGPAFARHSAALRDRIAESLLLGDQNAPGGSDDCAAEAEQSGDATVKDRSAAPLPPALNAPIERLYWALLIYELLPPGTELEGGPSAVEEALSERLRLRGETRRLMRQLQELKARLPQLIDPHAAPSATVAVLDQAQPSALLLFSLLEGEPVLQERLHRYAQSWQHVHPSMGGDALRKLGLPPGPLYGEILRRLRMALLDGEIEAGAAEQQLAEEIIREKRATA